MHFWAETTVILVHSTFSLVEGQQTYIFLLSGQFIKKKKVGKISKLFLESIYTQVNEELNKWQVNVINQTKSKYGKMDKSGPHKMSTKHNINMTSFYYKNNTL